MKGINDDRRGIRPNMGQRVLFTVWDGNNAPIDLEDWTGVIIEKRNESGMVFYIIRRDLDKQLIRLSRGHLRKIVK